MNGNLKCKPYRKIHDQNLDQAPALKDLLNNKNGEWVTGTSKNDLGNIANIKTIESYSKYCKDVDIITADCGMEKYERKTY